MSANTPATQDIPGNTPKKQKTQETPKSIPESISEQLKDENGRSAVKKAMEDIVRSFPYSSKSCFLTPQIEKPCRVGEKSILL